MVFARVARVGLTVLAVFPILSSQVPPQAIQILKPVVTKLAEKLLTPKMQVESFSLGGFKATQVDPDGDATPEKFSGSALFDLPQPLGPRKLEFKNLVLKGGVAEGTLDSVLKDFSSEHQGWTYHLTKVVLSEKGSRVEGTATLAGLKLDVGPLVLSSQGLQGTLTPGDLSLAEGSFDATLLGGEVTFSPQGVRLKGNLEVMIAPPVRHGMSGEDIRLEGGSVTFDSALLKKGSGVVAPTLAANLPLLHKGNTWIFQKVSFGFERGMPVLGGPVRLQFPLNVFCRVGATDQPYQTDALPCHFQGRVPAPAVPTPSGARATVAARRLTPTRATDKIEVAWEGFSGSFALPAAALHPSGLTTYRLDLEKGSARVEKGVLDSNGTRVTGRLSWGPSFTFQTSFSEVQASLEDGLFVHGSALSKPAEVGAYRVYTIFSSPICDFSRAHSPEGLPESWVGVYLPVFHLSLPVELFTFKGAAERMPVLVAGKAGRFEGNGTFSGNVGVKLTKLVNLHFAPVRLDPFELNFLEGALLNGPQVKGNLELLAPPLLQPAFTPPISFRLTQNGAEQIEINTLTPQGPMALKTKLTGVFIVLDAARLFPTILDLSGRFDFAIEGTTLPSIGFDHLALEASGGGIDGSQEELSLDFKGQRWSNLPDRPGVTLWGYPFALSESGYGVRDGRFYVGLGGDIEMNPLVPALYNRFLFTTVQGSDDTPTIELEKPYTVNQSLASLGSLNASLGFQVKTAGEQVSDAYFMGDGALKINVGDTPFSLDTGMRFGRSFQGGSSFPYFFAMGHFQAPGGGIPVAPNLELYGLAGGLSQNFLPDDIRTTKDIQGKPDSSLGLAVMAGVDVGTTDQFTFNGELDLYISQNLTTMLQGKGWLFTGRQANPKPEDKQVSADIRFTRNPNTFHATLEADLNLYDGIMRAMGQVELHFGPDQQFVHIGTRETPITVRFLNSWDGWGYFTADFVGGSSIFGAGGGVTYRKGGSFGIVYGEAWLTAQGDMIIEVDADMNPHFLGAIAAEGGASFGMKFKTYKTHKITIFSGSIGANLAFQAPERPTFSGSVTIRYRVLGGLFKGSVNASLDI